MLFPLGTDRPLGRPPLVTPALIGLNVAVFLAQMGLLRADPARYRELLADLWVFRGDFHWWTLITSAFLHSTDAVWHILGNMLFLWVFGPNIEDRLGRVGFLIFYLLGAAASGCAHLLFSTNPAIGASGAIAACTGAYMVMFPRTTVRCFALLVVVGVVRVPAWWFIGFAIAWDLLLQGSGAATRVAHAAHLGGYAFGISVSLLLLGLRVVPREPFDLFSLGRQAYRRRQIREATRRGTRRDDARRARAEQPDPHVESLAAARAELTRLVSAGDSAGAGAAYRRLADQYGDRPGAVTLPRRHQYDLANMLYVAGQYDLAAYAYERFIETYPTDGECAQIRALLGIICARQLNDPVRAKALIAEALPHLEGDALRRAKDELASLG